MKAIQENNNFKKINKWILFLIAIISLLSMFIGAVVGMTVKSVKIDEAYICAKQNQKQIQELREIMIRIDENLKTVKIDIQDLKIRGK